MYFNSTIHRQWYNKYILTKGRYSKLSIIRPGHSWLLEFEKDSIGRLLETFPNIQTRLFNRAQKYAMAALK